jgi:hypothetical protein
MHGRIKKIALLAAALLMLMGSSRVQRSLDDDRDRLGLTHAEALEDAPPVLAFTTVALGGFRGLLSNALWMRATQLQEDDKYFEMAQLAEWITKLEPHYVQVWIVQAWNMAYNISVKFSSPVDRWRWVKRGIELLRDEGLRYNPNEILMYRELAWFFQHKMGANLDDASMYYKQQWKEEMDQVFGGKKPTLDELIHPQTPDETNRAALLRNKFKMDPVFMDEVDKHYGPLEWRLPEASAIYWAALGLREAERHPEKVNTNDIITLRRVIYQDMLMAFERGRLIDSPMIGTNIQFAPNLDIIPNVNAAYLEAMTNEPAMRDNISTARRSFLRDAVYFLYIQDREADAARWFKYLGEQYPDKPILDGQPDSLPGKLTLAEYAIQCSQVDLNDLSSDKIKNQLEGLLYRSYMSLLLNEDGRSAAYQALAQQAWEAFRKKIPDTRWAALAIPEPVALAEEVRNELLDPTNGLPPLGRAYLRGKLRMPPEGTPANSPSTNAPATEDTGLPK